MMLRDAAPPVPGQEDGGRLGAAGQAPPANRHLWLARQRNDLSLHVRLFITKALPV